MFAPVLQVKICKSCEFSGQGFVTQQSVILTCTVHIFAYICIFIYLYLYIFVFICVFMFIFSNQQSVSLTCIVHTPAYQLTRIRYSHVHSSHVHSSHVQRRKERPPARSMGPGGIKTSIKVASQFFFSFSKHLLGLSVCVQVGTTSNCNCLSVMISKI